MTAPAFLSWFLPLPEVLLSISACHLFRSCSDLLSCRNPMATRRKSDVILYSYSEKSDLFSRTIFRRGPPEFRLYFVQFFPANSDLFSCNTGLPEEPSHSLFLSGTSTQRTFPLHFVDLFSIWTPVLVLFCPIAAEQKSLRPHVRLVQKSSATPQKTSHLSSKEIPLCTPPHRNLEKRFP